MSDWSSIRAWHKDDIERLVKTIHTASAAARPGSDEYREGHTAALVALCLAAGIDARAVGLLPPAPPPAQLIGGDPVIVDQYGYGY